MTETRCRATPMGGFGLLEVLVGLAIAALMLAWMLPAALDVAQRATAARRMMEAVRLAREQTELLGVWPARAAEPGMGESGPLRWQVELLAVERTANGLAAGLELRTYRITVTERGRSTPLLDLTLRRLGRST